ncbi:alanyl-tRNA editing protein [Alkaliphilus serpentinus]|uniref:Alanine--tRNA ligase n=1 Tax=Alkaliphilus serpentinus TaxID=1482731 RepID=A0A833HPH7_9FIRM|nr:DHHA1 domain-containing protein [Alkaliphilus serpentinus]KAB3530720.1 metal-dependent hydrolase [Alkaliphilus serpentinus]
MTKKLFWEDPYLSTFTSSVISVEENENWPGKFLVVLDETGFYPEGGGQPWDEGNIGDGYVSYVFIKDGVIYHVVDQDPGKGAIQKCRIDWDRRFDFMQQHLGQHILSSVFEKHHNAETVGFHLGTETVTIDLTMDSISDEELQKVELEANNQIYKNLKVQSLFPSVEGLKELPLRKQPTTDEDIRIIEIKDYDYSPCGGTHPAYTGEVGMVKVRKWEKVRGNIRIEFACGLRALKDFIWKNQQINSISALLSLKDVEAYEGTERIYRELRDLNKKYNQQSRLLLEYQVKEYHREAEEYQGISLVSLVFEDKDMKQLQTLAAALNQYPNTVALLAAKGDKAQVVFTRSKDLSLDISKLFKEVIGLIDGKGGGNPITAQGGGDNVANLQGLMDAAVIKLKHEYVK